MLLELCLVSHDIVIGAREVLLQLIVEGLPTDLNADAKHDMNIDNCLFQSGI